VKGLLDVITNPNQMCEVRFVSKVETSCWKGSWSW